MSKTCHINVEMQQLKILLVKNNGTVSWIFIYSYFMKGCETYERHLKFRARSRL